MKSWEPIAYPGPDNAFGAATHRNFNQSTGDRGSWIDALGYQQMIDSLVATVLRSGLTESGTDHERVAKAIRSQRMNYIPTVTGSANALAVELYPQPEDWAALTGVPFRALIAATNTAAVTFGVAGLAGTRDLRYPGDESPMLPGELIAGAIRTFMYDGTRVQLIDAGSRVRAGVSFRGMQLITAGGGTWDPASKGLTVQDRILVLVWGSGGGGSSIQGSYGGGGGGGGLAIKSMNAPASPVAITVGAPGAGNNVGGPGGAGGTVSFGSHCSATGGGGGSAGPGAGGVGVGGDVNLSGGNGGDIIGPNVPWANGGAAPFMGGSQLAAGSNPIGSGGAATIEGPSAENGTAGAILIIW